MARVAVTGAAGGVGRVTLRALSDDHEVTPLTHREHDDIDGELLEVTDPEDAATKLAGHDVVVHLAGDPSPSASWESVLAANIDGTRNVYRASVDGGVERVVFASTNHVVEMHNAHASEPAPDADGESSNWWTLDEDPRTVRPEDAMRPDSYYGVSKGTGELLGSYFADRYGIEVVNVRIGWLLTPEELRERQGSAGKEARTKFLSPRDWSDLVSRAVIAELPENPTTVNGVSRNRERFLSVGEAMRALGAAPGDDSDELL